MMKSKCMKFINGVINILMILWLIYHSFAGFHLVYKYSLFDFRVDMSGEIVDNILFDRLYILFCILFFFGFIVILYSSFKREKSLEPYVIYFLALMAGLFVVCDLSNDVLSSIEMAKNLDSEGMTTLRNLIKLEWMCGFVYPYFMAALFFLVVQIYFTLYYKKQNNMLGKSMCQCFSINDGIKKIRRLFNILMILWLIYFYACSINLLQLNIFDFVIENEPVGNGLSNKLKFLSTAWLILALSMIAYTMFRRVYAAPYVIYSVILAVALFYFANMAYGFLDFTTLDIEDGEKLDYIVNEYLIGDSLRCAIVCLVFSIVQIMITCYDYASPLEQNVPEHIYHT